MKYKTSIFLFTRDLRLYDNTTLMHALESSEHVLPIFIFNPVQLSNSNKYKSNNCIQFMCECLDDLNLELEKHKSRLFLFYGNPIQILKKLIKTYDDIEAIFMNKDYTEFAKTREQEILDMCTEKKIIFESYNDYLLMGNNKVTNSVGNTYVKFTPFFRAARQIKIPKPIANKHKNYVSSKKKFSFEYDDELSKFYKSNPNIWVNGGRTNGLVHLNKIKKLKKYDTTRDNPIEATSNLSAYLKFNVLSIREVYWKITDDLGSKSKLLSQLYWRDFYMSIMSDYKVLNKNMNGKKIKWKGKISDLEAWKNGNTGYPLVDAGMRQLNLTGYMHNRVRMVVASFLVKILHFDWKIGEQYFASKLVDYDPANNNGGWQWVAGTGTDSQPYFRYLNPWAQGLKFDKDCKYIKKYVSELKDIEPKQIHKLNEKYDEIENLHYTRPLYDNVTERVKIAIKMYKY